MRFVYTIVKIMGELLVCEKYSRDFKQIINSTSDSRADNWAALGTARARPVPGMGTTHPSGHWPKLGQPDMCRTHA